MMSPEASSTEARPRPRSEPAVPVNAPGRLRIEHEPRALGVGFARPRLSWWLPSGWSAQSSYEIEATFDGAVHVSGPVEDEDPLLRPWPFDALKSRTCVDWRVRVRSGTRRSDWSETHRFETGLLQPADWQAHFVGASAYESLPTRGERGALYVRRRFHVTDPLTRARIHATAHGIYELHLDGVRVGDLELTPGFTAYQSHLEVQTYDVTELLGPGEHELVATVTDGWWRGSTGFYQLDCHYGTELALLAQLELTTASGTRTVLATDETWEVCERGPVVAADLMAGQRVDQTLPASDWHPARILGAPDSRLTVSPAPPARRVEEIRPVTVSRLDADRQVVDLGVNINGWVRVSGGVLGPPGRRVRLRHGEVLGPDGDVDTRHLDSFHPVTKERLPVGMEDEVVSAGRADLDFEPRHTTHGFRYVGVDGAQDLTPRDVTGVLVHTDMRRTGWFRCSDERVNALHDATVLSFRGNVCETPTDCPTRERSGWTGDWQLFIPTAAFLYDVAGFSDRWLRDLAADQWDDGRVPNFVPYTMPRTDAQATDMCGSAGWGDAATIVPYELWWSYGDIGVLDRQFESMRAWVEFALRRASADRHPSRAAARPQPAPHERYLWDTGFHWGEWLEPGGWDGMSPEAFMRGELDFADVTTAYLFRSLATLSEVAGLLGRSGDADHYRTLADATRAAWQAEFVAPDGTVTPATQANLARALTFGLVDDQHREKVAADLVRLIRAAGTHLGTGFLATPFLLPVLADHGYADVAYELLLQTSPPSWLHMIDSGATTVWENWEAFDADGHGSLNHYSKGAVVSFLHEYAAGLRRVPGVPAYRSFEVRPSPGGGLTFAEAYLDTPHGPIGSSWRIEDGVFALQVQVAAGTEARITLPDGTVHTRPPGTHHFTAPVGRP
jgi:alpha-L-rhamnosidase